MKVNMTPNPLDVVTIHALIVVTIATQWEFELHNNGELIDTSDVTEQLVFKAYKGGTEQILPENGSTPTTSPFLGDIKYPQGLLSDQEFLYRESPTEEDGLAKITDIKGNTLVWNQLAQNGNFADGVGQWSTGGANTLSVTDGVCKIQSTNTSVNNHHIVFPDSSVFQNNHTYLVGVSARAYGNYIGANLYMAQQTNIISFGALIDVMSSSWQRGWLLFNRNDMTLTNNKRLALGGLSTVTTDDYFEVKDIVAFDLTQMGLDSITDPSDFTSLFPLSYYSYNQGSLLSFNGNGIKTVGFNQWDEEWEVGSVDIRNGVPAPGSSQIRSKNFCPLIGGKTYYMTCGKTDGGSQNRFYLAICFYDDEQKFISATYANNLTFVAPSNASCFKLTTNSSTVVYGNTYNNDICVNISSSRNGTYEPYTSSTLSLPISTYFTNGMKSAGSVYDELTETKAITRVGSVDLGTLNWVYTDDRFQTLKSNISPLPSSNANVLCSKYSYGSTAGVDKTISQTSNYFRVYDSSFTDATAFTTAMSGVYLYYELASPTETSFTTASLVTENAEIPLSNEDGTLIGKCTEQLSSESGFFDAKIKLADTDGECYSNKLQFHVERSPQ